LDKNTEKATSSVSSLFNSSAGAESRDGGREGGRGGRTTLGRGGEVEEEEVDVDEVVPREGLTPSFVDAGLAPEVR
jgi:hypothetical protein